MIEPTLNWFDLISIKKTWQTVTLDKDDCTFSVVYRLLKIKSKAYIFKISLKFLEICSKHIFARLWGFFSCFILIVLNFWSGRKSNVDKKVSMWNSDFVFHVSNHIGICRMLVGIRKTVIWALFLGGAPTSICHFFPQSVHLSACPSVVRHISGTIHHLIIIFGTHMLNDDIVFFYFFFWLLGV